jgi:hypothetical protein
MSGTTVNADSTGFPIYAEKTALNLAASTVVKAGPGRLIKVSVITAGSTPGTVNDCLTTGAAAAANQIGTIPNTVGTYVFDWPCLTGIVYVLGTAQVVAVSYS